MEKRSKFILSPFVNLILYDLLLIATPFLMLQNYLQQSVTEFSRLKINVLSFELPAVLSFFIIILIIFILKFYKKLNLYNLSVFAVVILMMLIGQLTADYYINYKFYDLQNNWHYFAYGIFVLVIYRYLIHKKLSDSKIIVIIIFKALLISGFDEGIQVFISNRIFDISDIAKDIWGVLMGLIILYFIFKPDVVKSGLKIRHKNLKKYFDFPLTVLIYSIISGYLFLFYSSILTEDKLWYMIPIWVIPTFIFIFIIVHLTQFKLAVKVMVNAFLLILILQATSFYMSKEYGITSVTNTSITYNGFYLPYFDYMIYPNGLFRPVDKKTLFKGGDFLNFFKHDADILLIGSGINGEGGKGFHGSQFVEHPYFIYNSLTNKPVQIIIMRNRDACKVYNRMKKNGKKILFIIHI